VADFYYAQEDTGGVVERRNSCQDKSEQSKNGKQGNRNRSRAEKKGRDDRRGGGVKDIVGHLKKRYKKSERISVQPAPDK